MSEFGHATKFGAATPSHVYRCNVGHEIRADKWTTMHIYVDGGKTTDFNYCPYCFGEWAERQWPLTCEPLPQDKP